MWEYRRRRDHARAGRLFAQVLRLAGQFEAYAMGLEQALNEDPDKARTYITYLLDRVEQRSEEVAMLASDAALSDEDVLATVVAADVAIRQLHLLMTVLSESELPTTNVIESMGRINVKLMAIYRTFDRACEKMPLPDEAPISDKGRFRTLIQDRSYGMLAPEKHGFWHNDEDDN